MFRLRRLPALASMLLLTAPLAAQTLTPRAFWPAPVGTNLVSFGYSYQEGNVVTDPSLPVENADSETHGLQVGYMRFFSLAGRTASINVELPRVESKTTAIFEGEDRRRTLSGFADLGVRLAVNLRGAPAMTPEAFREFLEDPEPIVGISLQLRAPTGSYAEDKLLNLGTNRWSAKPEIGYLGVHRGWVTEISVGARLFGDNTEFMDQTREQDPLGEVEFHIGRALRKTDPDLWLSFDVNYFHGGRTTVDGVENDDQQENSRFGATLAIPLGRGNILRLGASWPLTTETGGDYKSALIAFTKLWR